jgi:hypothetical protein
VGRALGLAVLLPALVGCSWLSTSRPSSSAAAPTAPASTVTGLVAGSSLDAQTRRAATLVDLCSFTVAVYERVAVTATAPDEVFAARSRPRGHAGT